MKTFLRVSFLINKLPISALFFMVWAINPAVSYAASGLSAVWANEGGDKVTQDEMRAAGNPESVRNTSWDGKNIQLFGARNEVISFNLVLESQSGASAVSVSFDQLTGPQGQKIASVPATGENIFNYVGRPIELFFVRYLQIKGLSFFQYDTYDERHIPRRFRRPWVGEGKGVGIWEDRPDHDKFYPEIAVPLELIPTFPIAAGKNQSIWADIYLPKTATAGVYTGTVTVREAGVVTQQVPIQVSVRNFTLPDVPYAKTTFFMSSSQINRRFFGSNYLHSQSQLGMSARIVRDRYFQMAHRHRISLMGDNVDDCDSLADQPCPEWIPRLNGGLFTTAKGYDGPGVGRGNDIYSIGTYGTWHWKKEGQAGMNNHTDAWATWFAQNAPSTLSFLFLADEFFAGAEVQTWARWMKENPGPGRQLKSFLTSQLPIAVNSYSNVDYISSTIDAAPMSWEPLVNQYNADPTKDFSIYNPRRPASGSGAIEDDGAALRMVPWVQYKKGFERWWYWESTYYHNFTFTGDTRLFSDAKTWGLRSAIRDPIRGETGTFYSNGNGVMFYPGADAKNPDESYGVYGPFASLRMKHWRRGIQDVDYLHAAAAINPTAVQEIVDKMIPKVMWEYGVDDPNDPTYVRTAMSWSDNPEVWEITRKQLANIIAPNVSQNQPEGRHEGLSCGYVTGWACDADDVSLPLTVNVYVDGPSGPTLLKSVAADVPREQGIADRCGGYANHGFRFALPTALKDGQAHTLHAYAMNVGTGGAPVLLQDSPKSVTCSAPVLIGRHEASECLNMRGWACDPDDFNAPLEVQFYQKNPDGTQAILGTVTANKTREATVAAACGGNAAHGFEFTSPWVLKDSQPHTIYAQAINIGGVSANPLLLDSPKTLACAPQIPIGQHIAADCTSIRGWACDADDFSTPVKVHLYQLGPLGEWNGLANIVAELAGGPTVAAACGGNAAHGFEFSTPVEMKNGQPQKIHAYAINIGGGVGNPLLENSPITLTCNGTVPIGNHELSDCSTLRGWTCDLDNINTPVEVHFYESSKGGPETFVGSTTANLPREPRVGALCGGNATHGFEIPTPASLKDGNPHSISAYAINIGGGSGNRLLGDSPQTITCNPSAPIGYHDYSDCSIIRGWTCDADDFSAPLQVHFYQSSNGSPQTFMGTATANISREPEVGALCGGTTLHGFQIPTPAELKDGQPHTISAYAINIGGGNGNPILAESPRTITCAPPNPIGYQDAANCSNIRGWTCDPDDFNAPLQVHLYQNGPGTPSTFMTAVTANVSREPGVAAMCGGNAAHGFEFPTPLSLKDGTPHTIHAYGINIAGGTGNPLLGDSPQTLTCAVPGPIGYHEVTDCSTLRGWTCDPAYPDVPLRVHFYDRGDDTDNPAAFVGLTFANVSREPAVGAMCGGNPAHGFEIPTPEELKDGRLHTIYAYPIKIGGNSAIGSASLLQSGQPLLCSNGTLGSWEPLFFPDEDSSVNANATSSFAVRVFPNPHRADLGHTGMTFAGMPANSTVKLFTVSAHWFKTLAAPNGSVSWDLTNDSGERVASGIYFYLATDPQGHTARGKFAVIR